eukprot:CAMPEP_0197493614 /NCGR_PEP_ID=MMETSP1311-20131121/23413_1 /TAXON_ID=464262 /ORGANISM="Genus nov. species nov., Strain RCC856" /LENGTH=71 /DNA_ID=CAMNT_0043038893 /DNA_START=105 /DNA_END=317 /DNA_ORIENTATION=+
MSYSETRSGSGSGASYSSLGRGGRTHVWEYSARDGRVGLGDTGGQRWPQVYDSRPALRHACERPAPRVRVS